MSQPIPSNSIRPLRVGERVQIVPEWQDPGDDEFERVVVEAPPDSDRVLVRTLIPGMEIQPTEIIEALKLIRVVDFGRFADMAPEAVLLNHLPELNREQRLFFVEKFPAIALEIIGSGLTDEEVALCCELHPSIALAQTPERISNGWISQLAESHSFAVLLHASDRLTAQQLQDLAARHPGECIIILERHPESRLRHSLRSIQGHIGEKVARALSTVQTPGG